MTFPHFEEHVLRYSQQLSSAVARCTHTFSPIVHTKALQNLSTVRSGDEFGDTRIKSSALVNDLEAQCCVQADLAAASTGALFDTAEC